MPRDHQDKVDLPSAGVGAAAAGAAGVSVIPRKRRDLSNKAAPVHAKLKRRTYIGGRASLSGREFAEVNGGRGYRAQNNAYTARLALAMKEKRVKQNRLVLDVYDNAVLQRDGAHRAQAKVMLGEKVKVKAVRHKGQAPRYPSLIHSVLGESAKTRQRKRLRKHYDSPPSTKALRKKAEKYGPFTNRIAVLQSKASAPGSVLSTVRGKAAVAAGTATVVGGGAAAVNSLRRPKDEIDKAGGSLADRAVMRIATMSQKRRFPIVSRHYDRKAEKMAHDILPVGSVHGKAEVAGHKVYRGNMPGSRSVTTTLVKPGTKEEIGSAATVTYPTKRFMVDHMQLDPAHRGGGTGQKMLEAMTSNARKSKRVRAAHFMAFGNSTPELGGMSGARAWRRGDTKYTLGMGQKPNFDADQVEALKNLKPQDQASARRYMERSRKGRQKPSDLAGSNKPDYMSNEAAEVVRGTPWFATVKGGNRTPEHAAIATGAAVGAGTGIRAINRSRNAKKALVRRKKRNRIIAGTAVGTGATAAGAAALSRGRTNE